MNPAGGHPYAASPGADYDRGAERLLEAIAATCEPGAGFPEQVERALRATLTLFVADPELARLLAIRPYGAGDEAIGPYQRGLKRYGSLLRRAAASDPEASMQPDFVEPALIGGIAWQITRRLLGAGPEALEDLLPDLLEFVLVYYYDPEEGVRLTRVALATEPPVSSP
jgi:hypothetical protein